jgi:PKHD-type hydroxylase
MMDTRTHFPFDDVLTKMLPKYPDYLSYYFFKDGFSKEECKRIIESFAPKCTEDGTIFKHDVDKRMRKSKITWIPRNRTTQWIYDRLLGMAKEANDSMFGFDITTFRDQIQFGLYDGSENGKYDNHIDVGTDDITACRKLSMSVQLSEPSEYVGGDLVIDNQYICPKDSGTVVAFSSFITHKVTPVTNGKRYSLVIWLYGPPFK